MSSRPQSPPGPPGAARPSTGGLAPEQLSPPPEVQGGRLRRQLLIIAAIVIGAVALITLVPGLASLRERFAQGDPVWIGVGAALKVLSGVCYVMAFRSVFCARMRWSTSTQIGFSELGANAVIPTGGAGGLALGAWALRRGGMDTSRIARRSVAFFFLTSVPNVLCVIVLGVLLAARAVPGRAGLGLTLAPALVAIAAIALTVLGGRRAARAGERAASSRGVASRAARVLRTVGEGVSESLALLRHADGWLLAGLAGYLAFDVMILWATFNAFGAAPALAILWMGYLIGELGGLIPVPGGIGGVDLGLVGMLVLYRVKVGEATAAVLAYRGLALLVPAVLGGAAFVLLRRTIARERLAVSGCGPGEEVEIIGRGTVRMPA